MAIEKYNGTWDYTQAAHLLKRTMYGPSKEVIENAVKEGLDKTVEKLLLQRDLPSPPVNQYYGNDPNVPIGATWVEAPYISTQGSNTSRNRSLAAWTIELTMSQEVSVREKMVLFWHNHFVTADVNDPRFIYRYITTIRKNALGNFRELTKEITIEPSMLRYLNGQQNTRFKPNENYARELLELFTVGKGETAGSGDYTTFTEEDVLAMAKILTGWRHYGFNSNNRPDFGSYFTSNRHDTSTKKLSHRFNEAEIINEGEDEYKTLIDTIFKNRDAAVFIARKLYAWFAYHDITNEVEVELIQPLANIIVDDDYNISNSLSALLTSKLFYDNNVIGCQIKHPFEFVMTSVNTFPLIIEDINLATYQLQLGLFGAIQALQMSIYNPPSVAGWKAFYQAPAYSQIWINSNTLPIRKLIVDAMTVTGVKFDRAPTISIDVLKTVEALSNPFDINEMLADIIVTMFSYPLPDQTILDLKEILIPGLPDFEWSDEYSMFRDNPGDENLRKTIESKLRRLFNYMMNLPEFQLT